MSQSAPIPKGLIKSPEAVQAMRSAGAMLGKTLHVVSQAVKPGVTGDELDALARTTIVSLGGEPAFLGFEDFPATICLSINNAIVHGLPAGQVIRPGDVVGIDIGVRLNGWNTDAAITIQVDPTDADSQALIQATTDSLSAGIRTVRPGVKLGDVQSAMQQVIEDRGYGLVRSLTGHGIGQSVHEAPSIPNYGTKGTGIVLEPGMTFCLEPMLTIGSGKVKTDTDGWTIVTAEGGHGAHKEHTILVTKDGCEVLSAQSNEPPSAEST